MFSIRIVILYGHHFIKSDGIFNLRQIILPYRIILSYIIFIVGYFLIDISYNLFLDLRMSVIAVRIRCPHVARI